MSAQDRYTKVIESLVNGDEAKASELLHEAFVEKARDIWADLVEQDEIVEDNVETELEEEFGDEESGDFLDDLETNEDEIESEEAFGEDDDEPEMDMDADMDAEMELASDGDEEDMGDAEDGDAEGGADEKIEAEFASVEDALQDLKATFAEIMGDEAEEPAEEAVAFEAKSDDDAEEVNEESKDEEVEEASEEKDEEKIDEAAELQKIGKDNAIHPVDMPAGDDGKASPVGPGTDEVTKDGGPVSTDTKEPAPVKVATAKDMGVTHPGDGAKLKPETRGHGAEKKGKAE